MIRANKNTFIIFCAHEIYFEWIRIVFLAIETCFWSSMKFFFPLFGWYFLSCFSRIFVLPFFLVCIHLACLRSWNLFWIYFKYAVAVPKKKPHVAAKCWYALNSKSLFKCIPNSRKRNSPLYFCVFCSNDQNSNQISGHSRQIFFKHTFYFLLSLWLRCGCLCANSALSFFIL